MAAPTDRETEGGGAPAAGHALRIEPAGLHCTAAPGQTLLQAAEAAGIALPASCRNGTCRTCIARVRHGDTVHRIEWPGLSREERAEGWVLPCVCEPRGDVVLEAPEAVGFEGG